MALRFHQYLNEVREAQNPNEEESPQSTSRKLKAYCTDQEKFQLKCFIAHQEDDV